jgi:hypothetical protein
MLESERLKLKAAAGAGDYMSIAINADNTPFGGCSIPWERTVSAYNMKLPRLTIAATDIQDKEG